MDADLKSLLDEPRRRGRPPGRRNKTPLVKDTEEVFPDQGAPDVDQILNDQLRYIAAAQKQIAKESQTGFTTTGLRQLHSISGALVRAVEALGRAAKVKEELASRMSPSQLLEAAISKCEQQDLPTLNMIIRRLTKFRAGKVGGFTPTLVTAADAIAAAQEEGE